MDQVRIPHRGYVVAFDYFPGSEGKGLSVGRPRPVPYALTRMTGRDNNLPPSQTLGEATLIHRGACRLNDEWKEPTVVGPWRPKRHRGFATGMCCRRYVLDSGPGVE